MNEINAIKIGNVVNISVNGKTEKKILKHFIPNQKL